MTREELKRHCLKQIESCEIWARCHGEEPHGKIYEEHKLILELLEQKPCEDVISRQAVLDIDFKRIILTTAKPAETIGQKIKALPPVTPQPKTGHWIEHQHEAGENWEYSRYECSECHVWEDDDSNYCPDCGTVMRGSD